MAFIPVRLTDTERYGVLRELDLENKARNGLIQRVTNNRPGPPKYIRGKFPFPVGTIPQMITYSIQPQTGRLWILAKVHQYQLPDGSIRGGPDPLFIRLDDVVLTRMEKRTS